MFNVVKRIIIINDSVWFPLKPGHEVWPKMESLDYDFCGIHCIRKRQGRRFWLNDYDFLPSYALLFNEGLVNSESFLRFWKCYPLISSKKYVMQFGERVFLGISFLWVFLWGVLYPIRMLLIR